MNAEASSKRRIAILGGGVGAMTAAFELTNSPGWQDRYEITVYQMGWRLGGKGASGRNASLANRIEEHGLHIWFGFYHNAFQMIRQVYRECAEQGLTPGSPFREWSDAFGQQTRLTLMEHVEGEWKPWHVDFPNRPGLPGDDAVFKDQHEPSPWEYLLFLLDWMVGLYEETLQRAVRAPAAFLLAWTEQVLSDFGVGPDEPSLLHLARKLARRLPSDATRHPRLVHECITDLIGRFNRTLLEALDGLENASDLLRRVASLIDLGAASVRGMLVDGVISKGFASIDDRDFIQWLKSHGARHAHSALVLGFYDACFAYANGDPRRLSFAAGTALSGYLRMTFNYRGSIAWRMRAGMGDTIFAPLYLLLRARGVRFEFFQRVKNLGLSPDGSRIDRVDIDVQATLKHREYNPLVTVKGLPCWPSAPLCDQLKEGKELERYDLESSYTEWHDRLPVRVLRREEDFDDIVLGISIGALPYICPELIAARQDWRDMIDRVETVQTQALQLWVTKIAEELGWKAAPSEDKRALACSYVEPFDTYSDFSHLIEREEWRSEDSVRQVAYFCNCLPQEGPLPPPFSDPGFPAAQKERVRQHSVNFLRASLHPIWPLALTASGEFDWNILVDRNGATGPVRLTAQYIRANFDGSERYVLSVPGSTTYRMASGASGYANLFLAGDWTRTGLDGGCVEAAVISGRQASQAICGCPESIYSPLIDDTPVFRRRPSAPHLAAPSAEGIRSKWTSLLMAGMPPESLVLERNRAITATYAHWYRTAPAVLKWAGAAAFASHRVALALMPYSVPELVAPGDPLLHDVDLLRQTNNHVFADIGWAHLAFLSGEAGMDDIEAGLEPLTTHAGMLEGFRKIAHGKQDNLQSLIWEGNHALLQHEQAVVVQPHFSRLSQISDDVLSAITAMNFDAIGLHIDRRRFTSFYVYMWTFGLSRLMRTRSFPDIARFDHRWQWASGGVFRLWGELESDQVVVRSMSLLDFMNRFSSGSERFKASAG